LPVLEDRQDVPIDDALAHRFVLSAMRARQPVPLAGDSHR
jgi:hypothetical protein